MNYYQARELRGKDGEPTGTWHYTVRNDDRIYAVGYCAQGCPGHESAEAACEHYKAYLLDGHVRYDGKITSQVHCEVCGTWTNRFAQVNGEDCFHLCDEHCSREQVEKLLVVGIAISSS